MVFTWLNLAIVLFLFFGFVFAFGPIFGSILLAPKYRKGDVGLPYECGMPPHGSSWTRFGINYYVYALIFIAFDVDVLYLFPVSAYYVNSEGYVALLKVFIFLAVLALGVVYFWRKGVFSWPRRIAE